MKRKATTKCSSKEREEKKLISPPLLTLLTNAAQSAMPTLDYTQMFIPNSILERHNKTNEAKQRSDNPAFLKPKEAKSEFEPLLLCFFFKICQQICLGNVFFFFTFTWNPAPQVEKFQQPSVFSGHKFFSLLNGARHLCLNVGCFLFFLQHSC